MTILRWIGFLPLGLVLIVLVQTLAGLLVSNTAWWIGLPVLFFFGILSVMATMFPVKMAPKPPIAAAVLLTIFVVLEVISLWSGFSDLTAKEAVGRILVDIQLVIGAIVGAQKDHPEVEAGSA